MIPSNTWFPTSMQDRAAWFENFSNQFSVVATSLGFTAADVTEVGDDNNMMQFAAQIAVGINAYAAAAREFRMTVLEGNIGDRTPAFPANPAYVAPTAVPTGVFERVDKLAKRIRTAPAYTAEIGSLLGIVPQTSGNDRPPEEMQPVLKVTSMPGSVLQVRFVRAGTQGVVIETKVDNSDTWTNSGSYFGSPAAVVIPENAQNLPRAVMVRARYLQNNTPIGQLSDIVATFTQPNA